METNNVTVELFLKEATRNINFTHGIKPVFDQLGKIISHSELNDYPEIRFAFKEFQESFQVYTRKHNLQNSVDFLLLKFHIENFAKEFFNKNELFEEIPHGQIRIEPTLIAELGIDHHWCFTPDAALYGGAARSVLKKVFGCSLENELPLSDLDPIIFANSIDGYKKLTNVSDTKILLGKNKEKEIVTNMLFNTDITMNQAVIYNGSLYFSEQATKDITLSTIRGTGKKQLGIFEPESTIYQGTSFFYRNGFYRALAFLLSEKGDGIATSYENIIQEGSVMGRYWIILLVVKIMKIQNLLKRDLAIHNWYHLAHTFKATDSGSPRDFLCELLARYPEMKKSFTEKIIGESSPSQQITWIMNRALNVFLNKTIFPKEYVFPEHVQEMIQTRPFENLDLIPRNLNSFWKEIELIQKSN
jgi:hypothetical protein